MKKKLIEIPKELFTKIDALAVKEDRSVNKQIIYLLKKSLGIK